MHWPTERARARGHTSSPGGNHRPINVNRVKIMKHTILIVEDQRAVAESLSKLLQANQFTVFVAVDGAEATRHFRDQPIDLVVLDINLGHDNGWEVREVLEEIKPRVPTIVITAEFGQHDQAIRAGAEALIEKPIDVVSFLGLIEVLLAETATAGEESFYRRPKSCHYIANDCATFQRLLQERISAPLDLSPAMSAALPSRTPKADGDGHHLQTVLGDPTTTSA